MRKAQAKLSQFIGVVLLVFFFIFSMLYIKLFLAADDILRASFSFKEKLVELGCKSTLYSLLDYEYYKGDNSHLDTLSCSRLGEDFIPYNETHCINKESGEIKEGDYDEKKVLYKVIADYYPLPRVVLVPDCGSYNETFYLFKGCGTKESEDVCNYTLRPYPTDEECSSFLDDVWSKFESEEYGYSPDEKEEYIVEVNYTVIEDGTCKREIFLYELDQSECRPSGSSLCRETSGCTQTKYGQLFEDVKSIVTDELGSASEILNPNLKRCEESYAGECGDVGVPVGEDYYYFSERVKLLDQSLARYGLRFLGGISGKGTIPSSTDIKGITLCETNIFSVYQTGDIIKKGILSPIAYIMWGSI